MRKVISELFFNHESIDVIGSVKTGNEAIKMVRQYHPDVLILDLLILDINGLEALELIMDECPTPTIILSEISFQNINNSMLALLLGAFDCIIKPGEFGAISLQTFKEELLNKTLIAAQSCIGRIIKADNLLNRKTFLRQDIINKNFDLVKFTNKRKPVKELEEKSSFLRQSIVNEDFKLSKQRYDMESNLKAEISTEIKPSDEKIVESFSMKTNIRQDMVHETFKSAQLSSKEESVELDNILIKKKPVKSEKPKIKQKEIIKERLSKRIPRKEVKEEFKPIFDKKIEKIPGKEISTKIIPKIAKKIEKVSDKRDLVKTRTVIKEKIKEIPQYRKIKKERLSRIKPKPSKTRILQSIQEGKQKILKKKELHIPDITPIKGVYLDSNLIVIGASLGGPRTITIILKNIPKDLSCPILVVQHLTRSFIEYFVKTLNAVCEINVKVAENDEFLKPGVVYIAPGDNHMEVSVKDKKACIKIYKGTPVHFCIPSIDVLFFSAARVYKNRTLALLLTGMGEDGVNGLGAIQKFGGKTISESQETSILYGMPRLAAEKGVADLILPNYEIGNYIIRFAQSE